MSKLQIAVLASAAGLFLLLYFTCKTKPPSQKAIEKSRAFTMEQTDITTLLAEAKDRIDSRGMSAILPLEAELEAAKTDSARVQTFKSLSGKWYELNETALAGFYAEEAANLEGKAEAWGITGTTYALCAQQSEEGKVREFCAARALKAFESAISLDPNELTHRINLALTYADFPPSDNPMKGILMLRDLDEKNPDNPSVLFQLGRLAIRTGQWERAIERLNRVTTLDPGNRNAWCLLGQAYQESGDQQKAAESRAKCEQTN
ncbi:MAG: tetratricopeptide repeat protein [Saprospirales bacterium]|nr:tetratricopeptide repeat protein [Saprospirales bacterium]